jgi:hypothetical protein
MGLHVRELAYLLWQLGEWIVKYKQHPEMGQLADLRRQLRKLVEGQIQCLENPAEAGRGEASVEVDVTDRRYVRPGR